MELEKILESVENNIEVTEEQLQSVYIYLSLFYEELSKEELDMWATILKKIDKQFNEDD